MVLLTEREWKFITNKWGKGGHQECCKALNFDEPFKDSNYFSSEIHEGILKWISSEKGLDYVREGGSFVVRNLGMLAWLVRFASVRTVLERFPANYSEVYSFGRVEVDNSLDDKLIFKLFDVNRIEETCMAWKGVGEGALLMTKTKGTVEEIACCRLGNDCCEYHVQIE